MGFGQGSCKIWGWWHATWEERRKPGARPTAKSSGEGERQCIDCSNSVGCKLWGPYTGWV